MSRTESILTTLDEHIAEIKQELNMLEEARGHLIDDERETKKSTKQQEDSKDELKVRRLANLKKAREAKAAKAMANNEPISKSKQISALLKKGQSVAAVAEALNVSKTYVYKMRGAAIA